MIKEKKGGCDEDMSRIRQHSVGKPRGGMAQREAASVCHSETTLFFDLASDTCSSTPVMKESHVDMVDINLKS